MNRPLGDAAFAFIVALGLAAVGWVGVGYLGTNPLAAAMTALIAGVFLAGALELQRLRRATATLDAALAALPSAPPTLGGWIATLHPSLRHAVQLRVEGERVALPGPALTPYFIGLLVLLGMLGTFVGMLVTLNGTVRALQSTTDLPAMRAALAAPVQGLGLAFGTSIAGVAASALLGLLSALVRRDRLRSAQRLDAQAASTLRMHSARHQREQVLDALQRQAGVLPEVAGRLEALMAQLERQGGALNEQLLAGQARWQRETQSAFAGLASSFERSLQHGLQDGARAAGAVLAPLVEATLGGVAREGAALQRQAAATVVEQLDRLALRLDGSVRGAAADWTAALERHEQAGAAQADGLQRTLDGFGQTFETRAAALLAGVEDRHAAAQRELQTATADAARQAAVLQDRLAGALQARLDAAAEQQSAGAARWLDAVAAGERERLAGWTAALAAASASLRDDWQQAGAAALQREQRICDTLESTASAMHEQAAVQAQATIAEVSRLVETAAAAPRAAAELVGALREQLSASLARDNDLLAERSRTAATLDALLGAVGQATVQQREAVDALVASAATLLQQAGARLSAELAAGSAQVAGAAAQVTASAVEVASLGDAFADAVQRFGDASGALTGQLQQIEAALAKSTARSDEQLAYYVAQAREIVDLSISAQREIVDDLQRLAIRQAA